MNQWTAVFFDKVNNPLGMIQNFDSLEIVQNYNKVGRWKLRTFDTDEAWQLITDGAWRVNLQRNSQTVMTGLVHRIAGEDKHNGSWLEMSGADQLFYLSSRLVYPATAGNFATSAYDTRMGAAETTVKEYVTANATTSAGVPARGWAGLTMGAYRGAGDTISADGRFQNLLEFCAKLLVSSDMWMSVVDNVFEVNAVTDKSSLVNLSGGMMNMNSMYYQFDAPEANYIIGGGTGDLTARTFVIAQDIASINTYGRIEAFYDSKQDDVDITTPAQLEEMTDQFSFEITPQNNDPEFQVYDDYWIGDKISASVFNTLYSDTIRTGRIFVKQSSGSESYEVKIGSIQAGSKNPYRAIVKENKQLNVRISTQERN